jgi:hypothetical protein
MGAMPCPPRGETLALIAALAVGDREHTVLKKPFASHRVYPCAGGFRKGESLSLSARLKIHGHRQQDG